MTPLASARSSRAAKILATEAQELPDSQIKPPQELLKSTEPANFDEVIEEINGDLIALQDYLKNSVFYAAIRRI